MVVVAVVDDDASILDAMTFLIESEGWNARVYASGEAFLDDYQQDGEIDCLILDPHLDGISGADVTQALVNSHIPIIGLTARPESPITQSIKKLGVKTMLTKPVQADDLVATIRHAIDGDS